MWIRRSFGNDPLYNTVVQAYIDTLLQQGFNFECFIEGGRSRTGKLLSPKFGILNFIMDSLLSGRVEDTIICPVSTQYDKVIETEYEQLFRSSAETPLTSLQVLYQRTIRPTEEEGEFGRPFVFLICPFFEAGTRRYSVPGAMEYERIYRSTTYPLA